VDPGKLARYVTSQSQVDSIAVAA